MLKPVYNHYHYDLWYNIRCWVTTCKLYSYQNNWRLIALMHTHLIYSNSDIISRFYRCFKMLIWSSKFHIYIHEENCIPHRPIVQENRWPDNSDHCCHHILFPSSRLQTNSFLWSIPIDPQRAHRCLPATAYCCLKMNQHNGTICSKYWPI